MLSLLQKFYFKFALEIGHTNTLQQKYKKLDCTHTTHTLSVSLSLTHTHAHLCKAKFSLTGNFLFNKKCAIISFILSFTAVKIGTTHVVNEHGIISSTRSGAGWRWWPARNLDDDAKLKQKMAKRQFLEPTTKCTFE